MTVLVKMLLFTYFYNIENVIFKVKASQHLTIISLQMEQGLRETRMKCLQFTI